MRSFIRRSAWIITAIVAWLAASLPIRLAAVGEPMASDPRLLAEPPALAEIDKSFQEKLQPIFQKNCAECHNPEKFKGKLDLSSLETFLKGSGSGPVIVPGDAKGSLLYKLIQPGAERHMPPGKRQLAQEDIDRIADWIDRLPKNLIAAEKVITDKDREHWSFRPLKRPKVPEVKQGDWVRTPIDAFILAAQEAKGLSPAPPARKIDLIRRATFDLTGLPPTREEVEAFLKDRSADAYEKLIDRLLDSPRYGERWGRHWLDLARYADSDGFEFDIDRPNAFRYRDYVIKSFNADKPYDRFILEQLAGDELDPDNPDALTATGFCRNGPTIDNQVNEKNRLDELDDIISTTSSVFLGLTIGCARCHDHKYDPIRQRDYYQMLAIFNSREKRDLPVGTPEEMARYREQANKIDAELAALRKEVQALTPAAARSAGKWSIDGKELVQAARVPDVRLFFGEKDWTDYIIELEAKRTAGAEGFLVAYRAADDKNFHWVNFGGWANRQHGIEIEVDGKRSIAIPRKEGTLKNDEWYQVRISVIGKQFKVWLNEELVFEYESETHPNGGIGLGSWNTANRFRNVAVKAIDGTKLFEGLPKIEEEKLTAEERKARDAKRAELDRQIKELERRRPRPPLAQCIQDAGPRPRKTHLLLRGDHRTPGEEVQPAMPLVLAKEPAEFPDPRPGAKSTGRRLTLARWIANTDNPLTARVMVNRVWQYHFARGIVETSSNFGFNGSPPSHPELLDWLAAEFIANGWKLKPLHKLIMTSTVYMQSTEYSAEKAAIDVHNVYLWRYPKKRLEAEAIRDSILFASGNLNLEMYGPGVKPRIDPGIIATGSTPKWPRVEKEGPEHWRRSVYVFIKRSVLMPMMEGFDAPPATQSCERRMTTTVPTQALQLLNNQFANEQAEYMAARIIKDAGDDPAKQVEAAYWRTLSRPPTEKQLELAIAFLRDQRKQHAERSDPGLTALADLCHVLYNLNEFVYLN